MPKNLSAAEVDAFRARLCEAAKRRFAEYGVDGVSMRALADELGCSAMTPYRYFRDKQEIFAAVRAAAFDRFANAMERAAGNPGDARAKARAVGEAYIRFALRDQQAYRLMFDLSQPGQDRFPELVRASSRARRTMSGFVEQMVEEGVLAGDPETLGQLFWAASHGLIVLHLAGKLPGKPGFRALHRQMMQLLVRGARTPRTRCNPQASTRCPETNGRIGMSILFSLTPFIVFFVLMRVVSPLAGLAAAFAASVLLGFRQWRRGESMKVLEVGSLALFGLLLLYTLVAAPEWTVAKVRLAVDGGLLIIVLVSLAIGMPFTLQYARESVPKEFWTAPLFMTTNRRVTAAWAAAFAVMTAADAAAHYIEAIPLWIDIAATIAAFAGAVWFTR